MNGSKIKFGKYALYIDYKTEFAGNAYFNGRKNPKHEYEQLCLLINKHLGAQYYIQPGDQKRVWSHLNDRNIHSLRVLSDNYRPGQL